MPVCNVINLLPKSNRALKTISLLLAASLMCISCQKLDGFLFTGEPATLDDYDFEKPNLDGIDPQRITSELVSTNDGEGSIHIIFIERDESKLDPAIDPDENLTVVFSHGRRTNLLDYWYRAAYFEDMGFNVLAYDYRGYGASEGEASEAHFYYDVLTAYDKAVELTDSGTILSAGYSLGGAPAIWLCSPESGRKVLGCLTDSAFASIEELIYDGVDFDVPAAFLVDAEFDNESQIATVNVPFMLMHGKKDQTIDFRHSQLLWQQVQYNNPLNRYHVAHKANHRNVPIPSYTGSEEPTQYSHPDELPDNLHDEFKLYKKAVSSFVADALASQNKN